MRAVLVCVLVRALLVCEADTPENNVEIKGNHLLGGDIALSTEEARLLHWNTAEAGKDLPAALSTKTRRTRAVVKLGRKKWVAGEVPYELSSDFNLTGVNTIYSAMDRIMLDTDQCVKFRPKLNHDIDYLRIFPGDGCYSYIGRQGGAQNVSIGQKCQVKGVIMHELIHALGRWHEQSRPDRDRYIRVNEGNIKEGFSNNFDIVNTEETSTQDLPYDYDSIMHYDAFAFSSNDHPTITPLDEAVKLDRLGQRERLSGTDKEHIKKLYRMTSFWSRWSSWTDCSASCGSGRQYRSRECLGEGQCQGSSDDDRPCNVAECPTAPAPAWGAWTEWSGCSQSCGRGFRVRIRNCAQEDQCEGKTMEEQTEECNTQMCPEEAEWSSWSKWTLCSTKCEGGERYRSRRCVIKSDSAVTADGDHCTGNSVESKPCFVNVSCDNSTTSLAGERLCTTGSCYRDTCLAGLLSIGCYHLPASSTLSSLRAPEGETILRNASTATESLKSCGEYARQKELTHFGLSGNQCYCSAKVTDFIRGGPSASCSAGCVTGDCVEVFQIAEQEHFELSVRAFESCGPEYCKQEVEGGEMVCSGGVRTLGSSTAYLTLHLASILLLL